MLLNALAAMGLLTKSGGRFSNTPESRTFLSKDSEQYIGYMLMHHHHLMHSWTLLHEGVLSGKPVKPAADYSIDDFLEGFLMGMYVLASALAPKVVQEVDLSKRQHLLDLGGGPGTYAVHFCLKTPGLKATVMDLPTTRDFAEKTIAKFGLSDRIRFAQGDYLSDPLPGEYDVAWLSHILHGEGPQECEQIVGKAVKSLNPGGMILVHDFFLNNDMDGPLFPALFSLNMLLGTRKGQAYAEKQVVDMLSGAGVKNIRRLPFQGPMDSGIIAGEV